MSKSKIFRPIFNKWYRIDRGAPNMPALIALAQSVPKSVIVRKCRCMFQVQQIVKKSKPSAKPNKWMNSMFAMEREREARRGLGKLAAGRAGKLIPHFTGKAVIEKAMAKIHKELIRKIKLVHAS